MTQRRRKTLPPVSPKTPQEIKPLIAAMTEIMEVGEGVRGDPLDRKVTLRDLLDSGIGKLRSGMRANQPGSIGSGAEPLAPDLSTPPAPAGFTAQGSFYGMINLSWQIPGTLYRNHAYTNIYRNEEDNFANAQIIGREAGGFYTDYVRDDTFAPDDPINLKGYYYWITFTSVGDVEGPPNSTAGSYAEPIADIGYVIEVLTNRIDEGVLSQSLNTRIDKIEPLESGLEVANTAIATETQLREEADLALATDINTVQSSLDSGIATVQESVSTEVTRLDGRIKVVATDINTVQSSLGNDISSVQVSLDTNIERVDGELEAIGARYTVLTDVNGLVGGFGVYNDGTSVEAGFLVDRFWVGRTNSDKRKPFIIDNGVTYIDEAMIRDASIQEGQLGPISIGKFFLDDGTPVTTVGGLIRAEAIDAGSLSVGEAAKFYGDVQSGNYYRGYRGWRIEQNGTVEFNEGYFNGAVEFRNVTGGPPADADNTGSNTAADTNKVAGESATSVRDGAAAAQSASNRINDWTRPYSTRIDGNKIYTGDAYVDTLQIKGRAVTVTEYKSSNNQMSVSGGVRTKTSKYVSHPGYYNGGAGIIIIVSYDASTGGGPNSDSGAYVTRSGKILDNGTHTIVGEQFTYVDMFYDPNPPPNPRYYIKFKNYSSTVVYVKKMHATFMSGKR